MKTLFTKGLLILIVVLNLCACVDYSTAKMILEIQEVEASRIIAMKNKDLQLIDKIMAPDCIHITTDGMLRTKKEYIEHMISSPAHFKRFKIKNSDIRFYQNLAVITGRYTNSKIQNGIESPEKNASFTRIYKKTDGRWRMISHQATRITNV